MKETKPQPRVTARVCSLCGLDWKLHGTKPTTETCIELLLAEVRSLNAQLAVRPYAMPTWSNTSQSTPAISANRPLAIAQSSSA